MHKKLILWFFGAGRATPFRSYFILYVVISALYPPLALVIPIVTIAVWKNRRFHLAQIFAICLACVLCLAGMDIFLIATIHKSYILENFFPILSIAAIIIVFKIITIYFNHFLETTKIVASLIFTIFVAFCIFTHNLALFISMITPLCKAISFIYLAWIRQLNLFVITILSVPIGSLIATTGLLVEEVLALGNDVAATNERREETRKNIAELHTKKVLEIARTSQDLNSVIGIRKKTIISNETEFTAGDFIVMPTDIEDKSSVIIGESGSGKSELILRMIQEAAERGVKIALLDLKAAQPEGETTFADDIIAVYQAANPLAVCKQFPDEPYDIWRGSPKVLKDRFIKVQEFSEPFYKAVAKMILRLSLSIEKVTCGEDLLRRFDVEWLKEKIPNPTASQRLAMRYLKAKEDFLIGAFARYEDFFSSFEQSFDGSWAFEDVDCAVFSMPSLIDKEDADAAARVLIADYCHYAAGRKNKTDKSWLIIDEFSAISGASELVRDLAERLRQYGCKVLVTAQSWAALGVDAEERKKLINSLSGGLFAMRHGDPLSFCHLVGQTEGVRQTIQLGKDGMKGSGTIEEVEKGILDASYVKKAETGECFALHRGTLTHFQVLQANRKSKVFLNEEPSLNALEDATEPLLSLKTSENEVVTAIKPSLSDDLTKELSA